MSKMLFDIFSVIWRQNVLCLTLSDKKSWRPYICDRRPHGQKDGWTNSRRVLVNSLMPPMKLQHNKQYSVNQYTDLSLKKPTPATINTT